MIFPKLHKGGTLYPKDYKHMIEADMKPKHVGKVGEAP